MKNLQVSVHNEWDKLNAIIVGIPDYNCIPDSEPGFKTKLKFSNGKLMNDLCPGLRPREAYLKADRELDNFVRILKDYNVTVLRPDIIDWSSSPIVTPWWSVPFMHGASCPRDLLTVIGNEIIEAGMSWRCRYFEYSAYRSIIRKCLDDDEGCKWTAAPKPVLADEAYDLSYPAHDKESIGERRKMINSRRFVTTESDIIFEAADISRFGKDIFVQHGFTTNLQGIDWLRRNLGPSYRVHSITFPNDLHPTHIDATFVPILPPSNERRGIIWNNPDRLLHPSKTPLFKPSFDIHNSPRPAHEGSTPRSTCSKWLSMNLLHVDAKTIIVEESEKETIRTLESLGIKVIPCAFRSCYEFGGSFHCHTSCINREGSLENYFPHLN